MSEELTLTTPGTPRPARLPLEDQKVPSTSEFLSAADLYSVLINYTEGSVEPSASTVTAEKDPPNSSRYGITTQFELKRLVKMGSQRKEHYAMLKKYDGVIVSRDNDSFTARLFENASDYPVMEAEFAISDVPESEWRFVNAGAQLVWTISYRHEGSTRFRDSLIYLRRSAWTAQDIEAATKRASDLLNAIDWDESTDQG